MKANNTEKTKLTFIADTHHYSKTLGTSGKAYEIRSSTDQKCLAETGDIIDAAFEKIKNSDADAVMIAGDLTDDGERVCHEEFIEKLKELQRFKPVYVTLATHDWCCDRNPRRYDGDRVYRDVPTVTSGELCEMYRNFGLSGARKHYKTHLGTCSYVVDFPNDVVFLSLIDDQDGMGASGFTDEHLEWIVNTVKEEAANGKLVIGMEHHLLYSHISPLITGGGACCGRHEMYIERFCEAGMRFIFVGHSHIQRIDKYTSSNGNELYEINVGSLVGYPAPIVNITVDREKISIDTDHVEKFTYNGRVCTSEYLKNHATNIITRILFSAKNESKGDFARYLEEFHIKKGDAERLKPAFKALAVLLDRLTVYSLGSKIHTLTFGRMFSREDLECMRGIKVIDAVKSSMLSILDGALVKHEKGTPYYNVITEFADIPKKVAAGLKIKNVKARTLTEQLSGAVREILTGGEIDNNHLSVKR